MLRALEASAPAADRARQMMLYGQFGAERAVTTRLLS